MKRRLLAPGLLALSILTSGCTPTRYWLGPTWLQSTYTPQVGRSTYDEVVRFENEDGKTWVSATSYSQSRDIILLTRTWKDFEGKKVEKTVYKRGGLFQPATSETESVTVREGIRTSFVFDRSTKILKWCQYLAYQNGRLNDTGEVGDASFKPGEEEPFSKDPGARAARTPGGSLEARLQELQGLKDRKLISDEEYRGMRAKALNDFK